MRIVKNLLIFLSIFCLSFKPKDQMTLLFDKVEKNYTAKNYFSYKIVITAAAEKKPNEILDSSDGLFLKKNQITYQKISENEIVEFNDFVFFSSAINKTVIINKKDKSTQFVSLKTLVQLLPEKQTIKEKGDIVICELNAPKVYQTPYHKVEIAINKKTNEIVYQKMFMVGKNKYKVKGKLVEVVNPIVKLSYTVAKKNEIFENNLIKKSNYFTESKGVFTLSSKYSKYKLL